MGRVIPFVRPLNAVTTYRGDAQIISYEQFKTARLKRAKAEEKANQAAGKMIFDNFIPLFGWEP